MWFRKKKLSPRRQRVRQNRDEERFNRMAAFLNSSLPVSIFITICFAIFAVVLLCFDMSDRILGRLFRPPAQIAANSMLVVLVCFASAVYAMHYQPRIVHKPMRTLAITVLFALLLTVTKAGAIYSEYIYLATGSAVTSAIILTIAYEQRFALGMTIFYSILGCFAASKGMVAIELFITMIAGAVTCCYLLREIRTRMKLIEVTTVAAVVVAVTAVSMGILQEHSAAEISKSAGAAAAITLAVGLVIQGFLPIIEKAFGIATSMTLLDYSDANQPLLRKLALEAPGTYSHSLLIGSIAEAAAEAIGANGLLCRVGAYYHDIGKINKPPYFVENQMGSANRHQQLSPAMSQLVIVGHVKDGIEIAREYGLPSVLTQFIETHHGTTLVEYFYNEALKKQSDKENPVSESEFRYPGPKPRTKEAAILMIADTSESATRSVADATPGKIETIVHNLAMKRLQDGQFDECDLTLRELSLIESAIAKALTGHRHGRIAYPTPPDEPVDITKKPQENHAEKRQQ